MQVTCAVSRVPHRGAGFTLIEIMVVVVILGLLATMVVNSVQDSAATAREQKATADLKTLAGAVRLFHSQHGSMPSLDELAEPDRKGRRHIEELPLDPWGSDYVLSEGDAPNEFAVLSAGPNRQLGDEDDLSSRQRAR